MTIRRASLGGLLFLLLVVACSSSSTPSNSQSGADAGEAGAQDAAPDVFRSDCGHPGDVGNSVGVGKFCTQVSDCSSNTKATICTTLANNTNFFCTAACSATGPADQCGENATCQCQGGCGCYPDACGGGTSNDAGGTDAPADVSTAADASDASLD